MNSPGLRDLRDAVGCPLFSRSLRAQPRPVCQLDVLCRIPLPLFIILGIQILDLNRRRRIPLAPPFLNLTPGEPWLRNSIPIFSSAICTRKTVSARPESEPAARKSGTWLASAGRKTLINAQRFTRSGAAARRRNKPCTWWA
jgi:hypothetical protein